MSELTERLRGWDDDPNARHDAADELDRLHISLRYAAGWLSGAPGNTTRHPEEIYRELLEYANKARGK